MTDAIIRLVEMAEAQGRYWRDLQRSARSREDKTTFAVKAEPWEDAARNARAAYEAARSAEPVPIVYDEDRRVEVIERDVAVVWRRAAGGAIEYALDMETREVIGARIFLPARSAEPVAWRKLADQAVRALTLATEDRSDGDTVEMNVGDLIVMLGLLSAPQAPYPARHEEPPPSL